MITKDEYLKAKELIKNYNNQEKQKNVFVNKLDLLLNKSNKEIIDLLKLYIDNLKIIRYSQIIKLISECYFKLYNKNLGISNSKKLLNKLIERNIIVTEGDYRFYQYKLNFNI